jgi:hypothetical protein
MASRQEKNRSGRTAAAPYTTKNPGAKKTATSKSKFILGQPNTRGNDAPGSSKQLDTLPKWVLHYVGFAEAVCAGRMPEIDTLPSYAQFCKFVYAHADTLFKDYEQLKQVPSPDLFSPIPLTATIKQEITYTIDAAGNVTLAPGESAKMEAEASKSAGQLRRRVGGERVARIARHLFARIATKNVGIDHPDICEMYAGMQKLAHEYALDTTAHDIFEQLHVLDEKTTPMEAAALWESLCSGVDNAGDGCQYEQERGVAYIPGAWGLLLYVLHRSREALTHKDDFLDSTQRSTSWSRGDGTGDCCWLDALGGIGTMVVDLRSSGTLFDRVMIHLSRRSCGTVSWEYRRNNRKGYHIFSKEWATRLLTQGINASGALPISLPTSIPANGRFLTRSQPLPLVHESLWSLPEFISVLRILSAVGLCSENGLRVEEASGFFVRSAAGSLMCTVLFDVYVQEASFIAHQVGSRMMSMLVGDAFEVHAASRPSREHQLKTFTHYTAHSTDPKNFKKACAIGICERIMPTVYTPNECPLEKLALDLYSTFMSEWIGSECWPAECIRCAKERNFIADRAKRGLPFKRYDSADEDDDEE